MNKKYGMWRGIPREQVPWFPTIDESKCKGCKECLNFCSHNVYTWDNENKKVKVQEPFFCVVGCSSCAGLCEENAISFPPLSILKDLTKKTILKEKKNESIKNIIDNNYFYIIFNNNLCREKNFY